MVVARNPPLIIMPMDPFIRTNAINASPPTTIPAREAYMPPSVNSIFKGLSKLVGLCIKNQPRTTANIPVNASALAHSQSLSDNRII